MSFVAGSYSVTWNGTALGQMENGFEVEEPGLGPGEPIRGDNLGPGADQDGIYLPGNYYISCSSLEYDAAGLRALLSQPYVTGGSLQSTPLSGVPGLPGQTWLSLAKELVLTRATGTVCLPISRTCHKAILAPNFPIRYLMSPRHRKVPIRFQLLPSTVSSIVRYWTDVNS